MNTFLEGKKTYIGIAVVLVGFFGLSSLISDAEIASSIDSIIQLTGVAVAVYGRYATKSS